MKKRIAMLIVVALTLSATLGVISFNGITASAQPTYEKVGYMQAYVTATVLNVREGTSTAKRVICKLTKGESVIVFGKIDGWSAVYVPRTTCVGVVSSQYISTAPPAVTPAATPKPVPKVTPKPAATATPKPTPQPSVVTPPANTGTGTPTGISSEEQELLGYVNAARKDAGAGELQFDMDLVKCARTKAQDMVDRNYFSHTSPVYGSPFEMMKQFGISYTSAGENIAGNSTVKGAFDAWMNSEGHRKNILNPSFNFCGFGIVPSSNYGKILVQQFIGR